MTQTKMPTQLKQYEAMFLFDPTFGASFENCEAEIKRILDRAGAAIILCRRWDERRLAFKIKGRKRGVYALTYFNAPPQRIVGLERDAKLSEHVLRVLVLSADGFTRDHMERAFETRSEDTRPERDGGDYAPRRRHRDDDRMGNIPSFDA